MPVKIRYRWGSSSLGEFIVAASEKGVVAFEFGDDRMVMTEALQNRFTGATIELDIAGLLTTVRKLQLLINNPDQETDIAIDPHGNAYEKQVWALLRTIKPGETVDYGSLAAKLGTRDARDVTEAISANAIAILIPCHRVVKKDGSISGYRWGVRRKRALLDRERRFVPFRAKT
jgi:AraC family transcriptional regulator, regulatory protein of adaptative response / methylated-DNA-[protein]-cysteine methyltransferase